MPQIGNLSTSVTLESASFLTSVKRVQQSVDNLDRTVGTRLGSLQKNVAGLTGALRASIGGFAAGALAGALESWVSAGLEYASSLGEVAQQLGVTTKTLQEYRYVATQVGVTQETMDKGLAKLTRTIGEAGAGVKGPSDAFAALGIAVRDSNGQLRTTDTILPELVRAFSGIKDPAARAALEVQLFGKAGQQLDTMLAGGTGEVNRLRDAAHSLGLVLRDDQIANADRTADKLAELKTVLSANIAGVVADNADSIYTLADALGKLAAKAVRVASLPLDPFALEKGMSDKEVIGRIRELAQKRRQRAAIGGGLSYGGEGAAMIDAEFERLQKMFYDRRRPSARQAAPAAMLGGGDEGGVTRRRGGAGRRGASRGAGGAGGPTLAQRTQSIVDELFPDDARRRELEQKAEALGASLRAKLISPERYEAARQQIAVELAKFAGDVQPILDRLFPDEAKRRELEAEMVKLDQALADKVIDPLVWKAAKDRLQKQIIEATELAQQALNTNPIKLPDAVSPIGSMDDIMRETEKLGERIRTATTGMSESFAEMAQSVTGALQGLVSSIKGGDFLDVIGGVLGAITQIMGGLKQGGAFPAFKFDPVITNLSFDGLAGARASGGPVLPRRSYLVGERGPEILRMGGRGGSIVPNHQLGGPSTVEVHVTANEYFDARVGQVSGGVAAEAVRGSARVAAIRGRQKLG